MPALALTGVTGQLGRLVSTELSDIDPPRVIVRDPSRLDRELPDVAVATYGDRSAAVQALTGVEVLFMVSAAEASDRLEQHRAFIDAAAEAGVRQVVYTSFLGAAADCTFTLGRDHWATEEHLRSSGMGSTILRDSFYLDFFADLAGPDGVIRGPAGEGRVGAVARADVARCAAAVLRDPAAHVDATYELTGPSALTLTEAAEIIGDVTGVATGFENETVEQAYASRQHYGAPDWQLDAWVSTYTAIAAGELAAVTADVRELTGRDPTDLATLLR